MSCDHLGMSGLVGTYKIHCTRYTLVDYSLAFILLANEPPGPYRLLEDSGEHLLSALHNSLMVGRLASKGFVV